MRRLLYRPSAIGSFAGSVPKDFASAQVAFTYDNAIQLYFRQNFADRLIVTPSTSKLAYVDFIGVEANDVRVVAINEKGTLFEYTHGAGNQVDLGGVPASCSTSLDSMFYIMDSRLLCYKGGKSELVADDVKFGKVASAKNSMAVALYDLGSPSIEILFKPFRDERCVLPVDGNIVAVEWSTSKYLSLLTVTNAGKLQIWTQDANTYSMHCVSEQVLDGTLYYASFVHDFDYSDYIVTLDRPVYRDLLPSLARPHAEVIVAVDHRVEVYRQSNGKKLLKVATFEMDCSDTRLLVCDVRSHYTYGEMRRSYLVTNCTENGLMFSQTGVGNADMTIVNLFSVPFLPSNVKAIPKGFEHLVFENDDGSFLDWAIHEPVTSKSLFSFAGQDVVLCNDRMKIGEMEAEISFVPTFWDYLVDGENVVIGLGCSSCIAIVICMGTSPVVVRYCKDLPEKAYNITLYSKDIFALCSDVSVTCFVYESSSYQVLARMECLQPKAQFIPNPVLSVVVASGDSLRYYVVCKNKFLLTKEASVYPMKQLVLKQSEHMLLALTESALYQVEAAPQDFISQYDQESSFCLLTATTLADMSVVRKRIEKLPLTTDDFRTRDENYQFPSKMPSHLPESFRIYCPLLFPHWEMLDQNAQKYTFSYALCREHKTLKDVIPLISIWALRSRDQRKLVETLQFSSWKKLCSSYMPLWAASNHIVKLFVEYLVTKTKPNMKDIDEFLMLCVAINRIPIAKMVARMCGLVKIADFFANSYGDHDMRVKIQKNAFHAQEVHRPALSAMFFLIVDMKHQALKVLSAKPLLQLLVARLIDTEWKETLKENFKNAVNGFYVDWWCGDTHKAQQDLFEYELPACQEFSLDVHKYELLHEIQYEPPNSLLVNMQLVPYYIRRQFAKRVIFASQHFIDMKKSRDRFSSTIRFDFGGDCLALLTSSDESSESEEEEQNNETNIQLSFFKDGKDATFADAFERPTFVSELHRAISYSQSEIVNNIAKLFNCTYDEHNVRCLCNMARHLVEEADSQATVATIFFALSYALSDVPLVISILMSNINQLPIANCLDEFENRSIVCTRPDLLSPIADTKTTVCDNDINITNCLAFDSMTKNIAKNTRFNEANSLLFGFLHHRHQLLFNQLSSFRFSDDGIIDDIKPLGFDTINILKTMERVNLREKWLMSINDAYSSPFFLNRKFSFSSVEDIKMLISGTVVRAVCIDPTNNKNVVVATPPHMRRLEICKDNLDRSYPYEVTGFYDSPFAPGLPRHKIQDQVDGGDGVMSIKAFNHKVTALFKSGYNALSALDSHPTAPVFAAGNMHGTLSMWRFKSKVKAPDSHVKFYDSKIRSVRFSEMGDRVLVVDKDGRVYTTDFESNHVICQKRKATAAWFNSMSQFAVYQPDDRNVALYDTRSGSVPVVNLEVKDTDGSSYPIDVWENQIAIGNHEGYTIIFDVRTHWPRTQRVHSDAVTCLKYHPSGSFLVSGARDNSVVFTDVHDLARTQIYRSILPDYERSFGKRGIKTIALSEQAIVVGGYSTSLHVWTAFGEAGSALTAEHHTTAVDLRDLSDE